MEYGGRAFIRFEERFQWATTDSTSMVNMENSTLWDRESEEKLKKENLNPGEAESIMKHKVQSSVWARGKFRWAKVQKSRKKRQVPQKKYWTNFTRHRKYGSRSPRQRKSWSPTCRQRKPISQYPSLHRLNRNSEEKKKKENLDPSVPSPLEPLVKENLDPGIWTWNGHASLFLPGMSWIVQSHGRKENMMR